MDILALLGIEQQIKKAKQESPQERYARVDLDLGDPEYVGTNIPIKITGDYLAKIKYDGSATGCYFKFDNKHSSIIYAAEFRKRHTPFSDFKLIYLTNPAAQDGKHLIFFVGGAYSGEIEPSTGGKLGLTDSGGADIDPATLASIEELITLQEIDGAGDLQKVKEELETINTDLFDASTDNIGLKNIADAAIDPAHEGGHLSGIETDTEAIKTAIEKIDDYEDPDFPDHARSVAPLMNTDTLAVSTTGATDTISCAAGHHLEIFGFIMSETLDHTIAGFTGNASLKLGTVDLWAPQRTMVGVNTTYGYRRTSVLTGIRVAGATATSLTLTNYAHTTGASEAKLEVTVFYKDITD